MVVGWNPRRSAASEKLRPAVWYQQPCCVHSHRNPLSFSFWWSAGLQQAVVNRSRCLNAFSWLIYKDWTGVSNKVASKCMCSVYKSSTYLVCVCYWRKKEEQSVWSEVNVAAASSCCCELFTFSWVGLRQKESETGAHPARRTANMPFIYLCHFYIQ